LKKVLITGALGQNGRILSIIYKTKNYKVFGFVKKLKKKKIKKVHYLINNLENKKKIQKQLKQINPDIIIHLASVNNSYKKRLTKSNYKIDYLYNYNITKNLINIILKLKLNVKFIFAGSALMFGNTKKKIVSEKDKLLSRDYYGKYKVDAHNFIQKKSKNKFQSSTAILFNHDSYYRSNQFLLPRIIKSFKQKKTSFIESIYNENISGDFSHAQDICDGLYKLSKYKKNINKIILSSGKRFYLNLIINYLEKKFKYKLNKKEFNKKNYNHKLIGSNKLAKKLLNYKPKKNILNACNEILKREI